MAYRRPSNFGQTKPPAGAQVDRGHPISQGLVGCWLFNEGGGKAIYDIAGAFYTGLFTHGAPLWVPGRFGGKAIQFAGGSEGITFARNYPITSGADTSQGGSGKAGSFVWWFYSTSVSGFRGHWGQSNNLAVYTNGTSLTRYNGRISSTQAIATGKWYQAVLTCEGAATKLYLNGVLDASSSNSALYNLSAIGFDGADEGIAGKIDHFRLYNRCLSASEVMLLYGQPFAGIVTPRRTSRFPVPSLVVFDAASNSGYQAASSSYSWSHTCTGADRYLVVGISMLSLAQSVSGITYNGVAMTLIGTQASVTGAARVELWGLVAPATGSNTIAVTLTGAIASAGCATSFTNVNQSVPTEAFNSAQATNVGAADATVNVTTVADNDMTVDIVCSDDASITVGAGQTERANVTGAGGSGAMSTEGPVSPAGSTTMSWTAVGALATWAIGSVALRPVGSTSDFTAASAVTASPASSSSSALETFIAASGGVASPATSSTAGVVTTNTAESACVATPATCSATGIETFIASSAGITQPATGAGAGQASNETTVICTASPATCSAQGLETIIGQSAGVSSAPTGSAVGSVQIIGACASTANPATCEVIAVAIEVIPFTDGEFPTWKPGDDGNTFDSTTGNSLSFSPSEPGVQWN